MRPGGSFCGRDWIICPLRGWRLPPFMALVSLLILVTFVGEAVREAFDPKKFSFYK